MSRDLSALFDPRSVAVVGASSVPGKWGYLLAEGALSESFHPGESGLSALPSAMLAEIAALIPETELMRRRAAFPIVRNAEARALRMSR